MYWKIRDITLLVKIHIARAMVFPEVIYGYEIWTIKKAENWRIDAFKLWYWRRLESPLDSKKIKPVNPKENQCWILTGRTDAGAEGPIHWLSGVKSLPHLKRAWCWEGLRAGGEDGNRGWDGWMASLAQWTWVWASSGR